MLGPWEKNGAFQGHRFLFEQNKVFDSMGKMWYKRSVKVHAYCCKGLTLARLPHGNCPAKGNGFAKATQSTLRFNSTQDSFTTQRQLASWLYYLHGTLA